MRAVLRRRSAVLVAVALLASLATPAKDRGPGKGKGKGREKAKEHAAVAALDIPPGHLPPPGSCRIWVPGVPPGQQAPPGPCRRLERRLQPGDWLVYRPDTADEVVYVDVPDPARPRALLEVRVYDIAGGHFLRLEEARRRAWRRR